MKSISARVFALLLHLAIHAWAYPRESAHDVKTDMTWGRTATVKMDDASLVNRRRSAAQYPITSCPAMGRGIPPEWTYFVQSYCDVETSATAYTIFCQNHDTDDIETSWIGDGNCNEGYICLHETNLQAVCTAATAPPIPVPPATADLAVAPLTISISDPGQTNAEFLLLGQNDPGVIFHASMIDVVPADASGNWLGTVISCANCGTMNYWGIPLGAAQFFMNLTYPHAGDIATLTTYTW